jgi:hypothetical protein
MEMTTDDLLRALGEKTAEVFMLARRVAELERQLAERQRQLTEMQMAQVLAQQPMREGNGQEPEPVDVR